MRTVAIGLVALALASTASSASTRDGAIDITGAWTLNRDLTTIPDRSPESRGDRGRPPGGGGGGGGIGGRGGYGGSGGGRGIGGPRMPSDAEHHELEVVRRRLTEIPERLIITRDGSKVSITDGEGRQTTLTSDGKKQARLTGDGDFKSTTHFEGAQMIVEEDFGGAKVVTTYTPSVDHAGRSRLEVKVHANRGGHGEGREGGRGGPPEVSRIYDAEPR